MGKKWVKVDPAEIKVGDRVRVVQKFTDPKRTEVTVGRVRLVEDDYMIEVGGIYCYLKPVNITWYVRKPKPANDTYYAELEAEVKELKAERDELRATLDELDAALLAAEPPTRPDEPPVGTAVRKVATGEVGVRDSAKLGRPWNITDPSGAFPPRSRHWGDWIDPGAQIEVAEWVKP